MRVVRVFLALCYLFGMEAATGRCLWSQHDDGGAAPATAHAQAHHHSPAADATGHNQHNGGPGAECAMHATCVLPALTSPVLRLTAGATFEDRDEARLRSPHLTPILLIQTPPPRPLV
jgi:hypothetical protein